MEPQVKWAQKWLECAVKKGWLTRRQAQKLLKQFASHLSGPAVWDLALQQGLMSPKMVEQLH